MNMNQNEIITALMVWLEDNMVSKSELHFDNEGKVNSELVYQALAMQLTTL